MSMYVCEYLRIYPHIRKGIGLYTTYEHTFYLSTLTRYDNVILDVEPVMGIRRMLVPSQKGSVELHTQRRGGMRGKVEEELQRVGPLPVLCRDVALVKN